MSPPPFKPLTTTSVDPERLSPALEPDRVPPLLLKSTLEAVAVVVSAKQETRRVAIAARLADFMRVAPSKE
jgi:acyl transferase domain-containing protein